MTETKDLTVKGGSEVSPAMLLEIAVNQGADLDKLEKLMDLQERWEKNEAKKAYILAMSEFKKNPPKILKDTHVSFDTKTGRTEYDHASLGAVSSAVNAGLSNHGLDVSWLNDQSDKGVTVTCKITHASGHSESTSLTAPYDTSGGKNTIQGLGSTITYLQRYTLLSLVGLAASGQDDDGRAGSQSDCITEEQAANIQALISEVKPDIKKFCAHFGIKETEGVLNLKTIPMVKYKTVVSMLEAKR